MPRFNCPKCKKTFQVDEPGEEIRCTHCDALLRQKAKGRPSVEESEEDETDLPMIKSKYREQVVDSNTPKQKYPFLRIFNTLLQVQGAILFVLAAACFVFSMASMADRAGQPLMILACAGAMVLGGAYSFACAELVLWLIDVEENTRKARVQV